ncbi:MAG: hypothetical protein ABJM73_11620 [Parasphingorhabdus sp.]|uniref:hypothetical protein n=1 Tax=Parasphingorhabdus sp. TaxID=2709688 RepID=UPI0032976392
MSKTVVQDRIGLETQPAAAELVSIIRWIMPQRYRWETARHGGNQSGTRHKPAPSPR